MCIICHKPKGIEMPSDEEISYMFERNPDGAGFAWAGWYDDGKGGKYFTTKYKKGFMDIKSLLKAIHNLGDMKDFDFVLHCRIKTSGNVDPATCHPFRVQQYYEKTRKLSGTGHTLLFHNGVFQGLGGIVNPKASDTQDFTVGVANRYLTSSSHFGKLSEKIVDEIRGSCRVLVMYPDQNNTIRRLGEWHEHKGCYYSNIGWKSEYATSPAAREYHGRYDDYYEDYYRGYSDKPIKNVNDKHNEWGANISEYAWPSPGENWIICNTLGRMEQILASAISDEYDEEIHCGTCTFRSTGDQIWFYDKERLDFWTEDADEARSLALDEEEYFLENGIDSDGDVMVFDDPYIMEDYFHSKASVVSANTAYVRGKKWYLDTVNLEAYTDEGLKRCFKPGDVGHIRHLLETEGTYMNNPNYREKYQYGYPTEDDFDDEKWEELKREMEEEDKEILGLPLGGA